MKTTRIKMVSRSLAYEWNFDTTKSGEEREGKIKKGDKSKRTFNNKQR
jgi:hypothetical protein